MSVTDSILRPNEVLTGGRVKGGIVKSHLQWVRDYQGEEAVLQLLRALPDDAGAEVDSALASTWCNFETVMLLDRAIEERFGGGRSLFLRELGRYSAHLNLSSTYRLYKSSDLHEFFRRSALLHRQFQDFGTARYKQLADKVGAMIHSDYACFSPVYCQSAIGYYEQAIVLHGAKPQLVIETSCQCAGDASCTFELDWE
jgi:hypothetical protein